MSAPFQTIPIINLDLTTKQGRQVLQDALDQLCAMFGAGRINEQHLSPTLQITASGGPRVALRLFLTSDTTQGFDTGSGEYIDWSNNARFEYGGAWWTAAQPTRIYFPVSGVYQCHAYALQATNSATGVRALLAGKNGAGLLFQTGPRPGSADLDRAEGMWLMDMLAGDYVEFLYLQTSGSTRELSGGTDYLTVGRTSIYIERLRDL